MAKCMFISYYPLLSTFTEYRTRLRVLSRLQGPFQLLNKGSKIFTPCTTRRKGDNENSYQTNIKNKEKNVPT